LQLVGSGVYCRKQASIATHVAGKTLLKLLMNMWEGSEIKNQGVEDIQSSLKLAVESFLNDLIFCAA